MMVLNCQRVPLILGSLILGCECLSVLLIVCVLGAD